jgi:hypothetical protein
MLKKQPNIYLSYRRSDSFAARYLASALSSEASVFMDVDSILPGDEYANVINRAISDSDIVVVVIGPNWLSDNDSGGNRRLNNPDDFVRREIEFAISKNKHLLPILIDTAMPSVDELPPSLEPLVLRHAFALRMGPDIQSDIDRLRKAVASVAQSGKAESIPIPESERYFSCFISYSHEDESFCRQLVSRLRRAGIKVWFADEDMKGGMKIVQQIYNAIKKYDRLLIVLSDCSINSDWVSKEIKRARKREQKDGVSVLFPIRLCSMETINDWELMDGSEDLASEVREYYLIDFSSWTDQGLFDKSFEDLRGSLRVAAGEEVLN